MFSLLTHRLAALWAPVPLNGFPSRHGWTSQPDTTNRRGTSVLHYDQIQAYTFCVGRRETSACEPWSILKSNLDPVQNGLHFMDFLVLPLALACESSFSRYKSGTCPAIGNTNIVSEDRWSLVIGSITLKCRPSAGNMVFQDRYSVLPVVYIEPFHYM